MVGTLAIIINYTGLNSNLLHRYQTQIVINSVSATGVYIKSFAEATNNVISNFSEVKGFDVLNIIGRYGNNWVYDYLGKVYIDNSGIRIYAGGDRTEYTVAVVFWY